MRWQFSDAVQVALEDNPFGPAGTAAHTFAVVEAATAVRDTDRDGLVAASPLPGPARARVTEAGQSAWRHRRQ